MDRNVSQHLAILIGCSGGGSFKPDTFSEDDMCIVKTDDTASKVCYGMSRAEVEKAIGKGGGGKNIGIEYDFGIKVAYRDDKVTAFGLTEESAEVYRTARGVKSGQLASEIKELYGVKYAIGKHSLDYYYDTVSKKFLGSVSLKEQTAYDMKKTLVLSVSFDNDGYSQQVWLGDRGALNGY